MDVKEQSIVQKLRNGDQGAYRYLYDRHYVVLCQFANELVGDPFLAETIVGDVIFHLWEIRETLDINSSLRAYLMRAVRNRCYNHISSEKEKKEVRFSKIEPETLGWDAMIQSDEQPLGILLERELEKEIMKSIDSLGDECKRVFRKSRFEHKKNEEIAQILELSVETVKTQKKKAMYFLRERLGRLYYLLIILNIIDL